MQPNPILGSHPNQDGVTGIAHIEWEDFLFSIKTKTRDQEIKGMDFVPDQLDSSFQDFLY